MQGSTVCCRTHKSRARGNKGCSRTNSTRPGAAQTAVEQRRPDLETTQAAAEQTYPGQNKRLYCRKTRQGAAQSAVEQTRPGAAQAAMDRHVQGVAQVTF
jgi:hypothetical protein